MPVDEHSDREAVVETMKREIDALQVEMMKSHAPWYRQAHVVVPLLVSVLALGFSFGATYLSEKRLTRQETHAKRAELRTLVQRLTAVPREAFQIRQRYADDPDGLRVLLGHIATENRVLAQQAARLALEISSEVGPEEYYAIGFALQSAGLLAQADEMLVKGLEVADSSASEQILLRQHALLYFNQGELKAGRKSYEQAMTIFRKYPEKSRSRVANGLAFTQLLWARSELRAGACANARRHIRSAKQYASRADSSSLETQIEGSAADVEERC